MGKNWLRSAETISSGTVEGELSVAKFLIKSFKRAPFSDFVAVHPGQSVPQGTVANSCARSRGRTGGSPYHSTHHPPILSFLFFQPHQSLLFRVTDMVPRINAIQHILIKLCLKERFEIKLIATEASCSVHTVQRIPSEETTDSNAYFKSKARWVSQLSQPYRIASTRIHETQLANLSLQFKLDVASVKPVSA